MVKGYSSNIEKITLKNKVWRRVLYTDKYQQLVVMSLKPLQVIDMESHHGSQFIRVENGRGVATIGGTRFNLHDGKVVIIPPRVKHEIKNTSKSENLKVYTIYTPPQHKPGTLQRVKPLND
jgi:mannose-6-phosphate isomerase-like protein (cupin superfamily)